MAPVEIFCCYARKDKDLLEGLKAHLAPLLRQGIITLWADTDIDAGMEWEQEINKHLNTAKIILLLVSPSFMRSDYCYGIEMKRAMERHEQGEARVIPIILRPVFWERAPFGKLQGLPTNAKAIKTWGDIDHAFFSVVKGINFVIEELMPSPPVKIDLPKALSVPRTLAPVTSTMEPTSELAKPIIEGIPAGYTLIRNLNGHSNWVSSVVFSPDGRKLISGSLDMTIKIWNIESGELLHNLEGHTGLVYCVAISPDGQRLVSGSFDKRIRIWDLHSGELLHVLAGHLGGIYTVAISPDGRTLISGSEDGKIKIWNICSGLLRRNFKIDTGEIYAVAISPDGETFVSGSGDGKIRVWNLHSGEQLHILEGHLGGVCSLAINSDEHTLISAGFDDRIKLWHLRTEQLLRILIHPSWYVYNVCFSSDGRLLAYGGEKSIKVWKWAT